eukprot:jgi/Orpsp1_1/1185499/evm.model.c7180000094088.1
MKFTYLLILLITYLIKIFAKNFKISGGGYSEVFLSNVTKFNYDEIKNLVVFGDSHSSNKSKFDKKRKTWPIQLTNIHNMTLWDFAIGGSVVDLNITYRKVYHTDLLTQYNLFYKSMLEEKNYFNKWNGKNTLFGIYIGSNDIFVINTKKTNLDSNDYINNNKTTEENMNKITDILYKYVEKLYETGGRHFMIMKLPPLHLAPINAKNRYKYYEIDIPYFNSMLTEKAKYIYNKYNDINIIIYNTNYIYNYIINNFKKFNFVSIRDSFKSNKYHKYDKYFWYDFTHITPKGNRIISIDVDELLKSLND